MGAAIVCLCAVLAAACAVPLTSQSLSGIILNGGALYAVNEINASAAESDAVIRYECAASPAEVAAALVSGIEEVNEARLYAGRAGRPFEEGRSVADGERSGSPAPRKQLTPAPTFEVDETLSGTAGDTTRYVIAYRRQGQVGVSLRPGRRPGTTEVVLLPFAANTGAFLLIPTDNAQRNALEELHQGFYVSVDDLLGGGTCRRGDGP